MSVAIELCRGKDQEIWYPVSRTQKAAEPAKKICNDCPSKDSCMDWGIKYERYGIWGGLTELERKKLRKTLKIDVIDLSADLRPNLARNEEYL